LVVCLFGWLVLVVGWKVDVLCCLVVLLFGFGFGGLIG